MTKEERIILEKLVKHPEGLLSPAVFINGIAGRDRRSVENLITMGYVEEVPQDINGGSRGAYSLNFYRATEKGLNQFNIWYKKFWFNFKNNITLYIAIASILFGLITSITSWYTVRNSFQTNIISEQPFLNFIDIDNQPYKFINSGKGVALNFFLILWDKPGNQLYVTPEGAVGEAIGIGMTGNIDVKDLIKTDFERVKSQIPITSKLFDITQGENVSWFSLIYEDIYGRKYSTLILGPGNNDYTKAVKFIELSH